MVKLNNAIPGYYYVRIVRDLMTVGFLNWILIYLYTQR